MSVVVGIDYSMSSPSICVHVGDEWSFDSCKFYFLTSKKKYLVKDQKFCGHPHTDFLSQEERFDNIASWALSNIPTESKISIEGYAFAAKGVVFDIAENTAILKHKMFKNKMLKDFSIVSPATVKKFATGKGNSNKVIMHEFFVKEVGFRIDNYFGCPAGQSPISDIIDSYYIAKFAFHKS